MDNQMSNPVVIMLINMTIVFAVLFLLSLFIRFIHFIDPTKPRTKKKQRIWLMKQQKIWMKKIFFV